MSAPSRFAARWWFLLTVIAGAMFFHSLEHPEGSLCIAFLLIWVVFMAKYLDS